MKILFFISLIVAFCNVIWDSLTYGKDNLFSTLYNKMLTIQTLIVALFIYVVWKVGV